MTKLPDSCLVPDRLLLRRAHVDDAAAIVEAIHESLEALQAFMPWSHYEQTVEVQQKRLESLVSGDANEPIFHACDPQSGRFLGSFGLHPRTLNPNGFEVGYWVRTSEAGRGLATLATKCLVVCCFADPAFERFQITYNLANLASAAVARKVGFVIEGELRHFADPGSEAMRRAGMTSCTTYAIGSIVRADLPGLSWYDELPAHVVLGSSS